VLFTCWSLLISCLLPFTSSASELHIELEKRSATDWQVHYQAEQPMSRLQFQRSPDAQRTKRWQAIEPGFVLRYHNGTEFAERLDGQPFNRVTFRLTATYTVLPKDYAPFSPFSDGGMLLHSGRFFACMELCLAGDNQWLLSAKVPSGEHILLNGQLYPTQVSWRDQDSGRNLYLGRSHALASDDFISLIDPQLPGNLQQQMARDLPELMHWFSNKLGRLAQRPALFASYSSTDDGRYGHQGGTLPGQIFMHWYGNQAMANLDADAVFWFFAHEVAHLYQQQAGQIEPPADAWVHEGAAEYLAGLASAAQHPRLPQQKLAAAALHCSQGLAQQLSYANAVSANPQLHYSCGLLLQQAIAKDLQGTGQATDAYFAVWQQFQRQVRAGQPATAIGFVQLLRPQLSPAFAEQLQRFARQESASLAWLQQLAVTTTAATVPARTDR